jgi:tRNA(fMet)-specific endonuclease VapC
MTQRLPSSGAYRITSSSRWRPPAGKFTPKGLFLVDKVLIDSSTLFDLQRAIKKPTAPWARNSLAHLLAYRRRFAMLTISGLTVFEMLEGLYRSGRTESTADFHQNVLPNHEVIHPDAQIEDKAAEIHAKLGLAGLSIDVPDTLIAATAIVHKLTLVNANTRHFARVEGSGFPLRLANWRDDIV